MPNKTTKSDTILKLISRKSGATLSQLMKATGWKIARAITGARWSGPRFFGL